MLISVSALIFFESQKKHEPEQKLPFDYTHNPRSRLAPETDIEWLIVSKAKEYGLRPSLVLRIINNESGFKWWTCHQGTQCDKGGGLFQVIPTTELYCEGKLGRELDMKIPADNIECGMWLLKNEGIGHWEEWSGLYNVQD